MDTVVTFSREHFLLGKLGPQPLQYPLIEIAQGAWSSRKKGVVGRGNSLKINGNSFARLGGHLGR